MESVIIRHRDFLEDRVDTDFGLVDTLYSTGVLSKKEMRFIEDLNAAQRSEKLLDYILEKHKTGEFIVALNDTGQKHLVNYIVADGVYNQVAHGENWPLRERETYLLRANHNKLILRLDTSELCIELYSHGVINQIQRDWIASKQDETRKNRALVDIIGRFSLKQYSITIAFLSLLQRNDLAAILADGRVVLQPITVNMPGAVADVSEEEATIVRKMRELIGNRPLVETDRLWELVRLGLIYARLGHSVLLDFHCETLADLTELRRMYVSGELVEIVGMAFSYLLSSVDLIPTPVTLDWNDGTYENSRSYLADDTSEVSMTKITVDKNESGLAATESERMAEVSEKPVEEKLKDVMRKHREFLEDRMDPDFGLLDKLLANLTLTKKELNGIKTEQTTEDRNRRLLDHILKKNQAEQLMVALGDTGQMHLVNYLNANGENSPDYGDDWPLGQREINLLTSNHEKLVDALEKPDLVEALVYEKAINRHQKELILSKLLSFEKKEVLLAIMTRFSLRQYKKAIDCLKKAFPNQSHISNMLGLKFSVGTS